METARYNLRPFKRGADWEMMFRFKHVDLTSSTVTIEIKKSGVVVFNSATHGTFTVTHTGSDTVVLWVIPYGITSTPPVADAYEYDLAVTSGSSRKYYLEGRITVSRNI